MSSAVHSVEGDVLKVLKFSDDKRVGLEGDYVDLIFDVPEFAKSFMLQVEGQI